MHILAVNSVTTLLNYLKEQVKQTATLDVIRSWGTEKQVKAEDSEKKVCELVIKKLLHYYCRLDCFHTY